MFTLRAFAAALGLRRDDWKELACTPTLQPMVNMGAEVLGRRATLFYRQATAALAAAAHEHVAMPPLTVEESGFYLVCAGHATGTAAIVQCWFEISREGLPYPLESPVNPALGFRSGVTLPWPIFLHAGDRVGLYILNGATAGTVVTVTFVLWPTC